MAGSDLYRGTLELLILRALQPGFLHGYGIGRWIRTRSDGILEPEEGVLYPALRRMEERGWIEGRWGQSETGRKARFYSLSRKGRRALEKEKARWAKHAGAVFAVLAEGED